MENNREDSMIECPFYKWNSRTTITCEGIADGMNVQQTFASPAAQVSWKKCFCRTMHYNKCMYAKMLQDKKYGGE